MIIGTIINGVLFGMGGIIVKTIPNSTEIWLLKKSLKLSITDKIKLVKIVQTKEVSITELECHVLHVCQTNTGGTSLPNV
jgi:hypothetical protein